MNKDKRFINFVKSTDFSLFRDKYAFFDTKEHLADNLFVRHGIPVRIKGELYHPDKKYIIVLCSVKKKDSARFEEAVSELKNKMLLLGHRDYSDFCREIIGTLEEYITEDEMLAEA